MRGLAFQVAIKHLFKLFVVVLINIVFGCSLLTEENRITHAMRVLAHTHTHTQNETVQTRLIWQ